MNKKSHSRDLDDSTKINIKRIAHEIKNLDSNSKHFLAGYIVAKNEQRDIQNSKCKAEEGV